MLRIFYRQLQNLVKIFSNWFFFDVDSKQGQSDLADNISKFFGLNLYFYIILFFCFFCVCCMIFNVAHFFVCYPSVVLESYFFPVRVILIFFCSILKNDMFVSWANYIF